MADLIATGTSGYATGSIDTASTVVNSVTATDAVQPNGLAAAIIGIETILGLGTTLKGNLTDLVTRLAVGIDANGVLKLSTDAALAGPLSTAKGGTGLAYNPVPPGVISAWSTTTAPTGYVLCDGSAYSRTVTYETLFAVIGTTYGTGDGSTTFNVPDMRGRAIIMVDGGANRITSASTNGANADTLAGVGGAETHTLTHAERPSATAGGAGSPSVTENSDTVYRAANPHSNTQPWIAVEYIIKY